jgi:hypothetical protein
MLVLKAITEYFEQKDNQKADGQLAAGDAELLERTTIYLSSLVANLENVLMKIRQKAKPQKIEDEIFRWIRRVEMRVLSFPLELRNIISTATARDGVKSPPVVTFNNRLQEFLALASDIKQERINEMLLKDSNKLADTVTRRSDVAYQPFKFGDDQIISASQRVHPKTIPGTSDFQVMVSDIGELAAALNCLDPISDIKLLKVEYYFYHSDHSQFLFAHKTPSRTTAIMTLEEMIEVDPFPRTEALLEERFKGAHKLAEAVFFFTPQVFFIIPSHPRALLPSKYLLLPERPYRILVIYISWALI